MVIAIIAILAALLSPALKKSRDKARAISCLSRQRQIYLASVAYANEHDGVLADLSGDASVYYPYFKLSPYLGFPRSQWDVPTNAEWYRSNRCICRCPADTTTTDDYTNGRFIHGQDAPMPSIVYNTHVDATDATGVGGHNLASIPRPERTCLVMDGLDGRFNCWWSADSFTVFGVILGSFWGNGISDLRKWERHGGWNIVFVDGHGEFRTTQVLYDTVVGPPGPGPEFLDFIKWSW